jgi:amino acid transporter
MADFGVRYTMIGVCPVLYVGWKITHRTKIVKPEEADLLRDLDAVELYEQNYVPQPASYVIPFTY